MKGNVYIFLSLILGGVLNFLTISVYSRYFTPEEYGYYSIILSIILLTLGFVFSWVDLSSMRFYTSESEKDNEQTNTVTNFFIIYTSLSLLIFITMNLVYSFTNLIPFSLLLWQIIILAIVSEVIFIAVNTYIRLIKNKLNLYALFLIIRTTTAFLVGWYLVYNKFSYQGAVIASLISFTVPLLFLIFKSKIWKNISFSYTNINTIKEIAQFGIPLVFVMVIQSAINATDRFLLAGVMGVDIAGQYSVSQDLVNKLFIFLALIINKVTYPLIIKAYDNFGESAAIKQLNINITLLLGVSIPALLVMMFYPANLINVLIGQDFRETSIQLMPYQVSIALINCMTMFYIILPFHIKKKTKQLILPSLVGLLSNLIVGWLCIKYMGIYGALLGSFVAYSLYFLIAFKVGCTFFKLPFPSLNIFKITLASTVMCLSLIVFAGQSSLGMLILFVASGACIYSLMIIILNVSNIRNMLFKKLKRN
ncbi:oligosaccharide flippase family protein [Marinicellulosiphila megalodicopiae]|uniref:oligosaccharide flippase family protein n=1 Tax=Marinicellulosiphila megalodicopiae TaxID=2724896 RepID=UPI003BAEABB8